MNRSYLKYIWRKSKSLQVNLMLILRTLLTLKSRICYKYALKCTKLVLIRSDLFKKIKKRVPVPFCHEWSINSQTFSLCWFARVNIWKCASILVNYISVFIDASLNRAYFRPGSPLQRMQNIRLSQQSSLWITFLPIVLICFVQKPNTILCTIRLIYCECKHRS